MITDKWKSNEWELVARGTHLPLKKQLNIYSPLLSEIIFWSYTFVMTGLSMTDPHILIAGITTIVVCK